MARIVVYDACVLDPAPLRDLLIQLAVVDLFQAPQSVLGGFGIEALHPDEFIGRLWDEYQSGVVVAARLHRQSLRRPPKTVTEYLATLEQCRLTKTMARLRSHEAEL